MRQEVAWSFPKPGKAMWAVLIALGSIWIFFAVGINWADVSPRVLDWFMGSPRAVPEAWRFVTAAFIHHPNLPGHILTTLLGIYFLGTSLEKRWGGQKFVGFLVGSAAFAFLMQYVVGLLFPKIGAAVWFGGLGMTEAVAVAWALSARNQQVRLFFVLPVSANMLLGFIFIMSVLNVIANRSQPEGLITPFGGMLAGYLFGDLSPFKTLILKLRLRSIQRDTRTLQSLHARRRAASGLRVIQGGDRPVDKKYLN